MLAEEKIKFLTGHSAEIAEIVFSSEKPPDQLIRKYFQSKKYLGKNDRLIISDICYNYMRNRFLIDEIAERTGVDPMLASIYHLITESAVLDGLIDFIGITDVKVLVERTKYALAGIEEATVKYSYPPYLAHLIADKDLLYALNQSARVNLRIRDKHRGEVENELSEKGISYVQGRYLPYCVILNKRAKLESMETWNEGFFEIQDEGSQVISAVLDPKPGHKVLDVCAGGGGKTLHIAELMQDEGEIVASDINGLRLNGLKERLQRTKYKSVKIDFAENQLAKYRNYFDSVLIDAPCSGSGTIRHNPMIKWHLNQEKIEAYAQMQYQLLEHYSRYVKPGGTIVYSTCSLFQRENEENIRNFLHKRLDCELVAIQDTLDGIDDSGRLHQGEYGVQLAPHTTFTDGFFISKLKRKQW